MHCVGAIWCHDELAIGHHGKDFCIKCVAAFNPAVNEVRCSSLLSVNEDHHVVNCNSFVDADYIFSVNCTTALRNLEWYPLMPPAQGAM